MKYPMLGFSIPAFIIFKRWSIILALLLWPKLVLGDTIAFFYALDADVKALSKNAVAEGNPIKVGSRQIQHLKIGVHDIYAIKMGAGCIETAISAQAVFSLKKIDLAISIGPAGSLSSDVSVGDWVRVTEVIGYQIGSQTESGFNLAENSRVTVSGAHFKTWPLPPSLLNAKSVALASGEIFSASENFKETLLTETHASTIDMNSMGLLKVCSDYGTPIVIWRIVSDHSNERARNDFLAFIKSYTGEGGTLIGKAIVGLPNDPTKAINYENIRKSLE